MNINQPSKQKNSKELSSYIPQPSMNRIKEVIETEEENSFSSQNFNSSQFSIASLKELTSPSLESYIPSPSFLISLPYSQCSSCGILPPPPSLISPNKKFIQLLPCKHILCSKCLNTLINSTANDPPRRGDCFNFFELEIKDFNIVTFTNQGEEEEEKEEEKEKENIVVWKTPEKKKNRNVGLNGSNGFNRLNHQLLGELSPCRNLIWSDEPLSDFTTSGSGSDETSGNSSKSTPLTTPGSIRSYRTTTSTENEISKIQEWSVVRIDNIPWDLKISDVQSWLKSCSNLSLISKDSQILFIHILCNRGDGRTLNQLFIELPNLTTAQNLIRLKNGKKIVGRTISIVLSSQEELMKHIFPAWSPGFLKVDALNPLFEGEIISNDDLEGLIELCQFNESITGEGVNEIEINNEKLKAPERALVQISSILTKFPFHQPEVYNVKLVARLFITVEATLIALLANEDKFQSVEEFESIVEIVLKSALSCPVFRTSQKNKLLSLVGLSTESISSPAPEPTTPIKSTIVEISRNPISPPITPTGTTSKLPKSHLRSPTFDRVKNTLDLNSNSSPIILPLIYSTTSTSNNSNRFKSTNTKEGGGGWRERENLKFEKEEEKIKLLSVEMGVEQEVIRKILEFK